MSTKVLQEHCRGRKIYPLWASTSLSPRNFLRLKISWRQHTYLLGERIQIQCPQTGTSGNLLVSYQKSTEGKGPPVIQTIPSHITIMVNVISCIPKTWFHCKHLFWDCTSHTRPTTTITPHPSPSSLIFLFPHPAWALKSPWSQLEVPSWSSVPLSSSMYHCSKYFCHSQHHQISLRAL